MMPRSQAQGAHRRGPQERGLHRDDVRDGRRRPRGAGGRLKLRYDDQHERDRRHPPRVAPGRRVYVRHDRIPQRPLGPGHRDPFARRSGVMRTARRASRRSAASSSARSGEPMTAQSSRKKPPSPFPKGVDASRSQRRQGRRSRARRASSRVPLPTSVDGQDRRATSSHRRAAPTTATSARLHGLCARSSRTWSRASPRLRARARDHRHRLPRRGQGHRR